jgi:hypothetical protein
MKKVGGLLGLVIALGVGYYIFKAQMTTGPSSGWKKLARNTIPVLP